MLAYSPLGSNEDRYRRILYCERLDKRLLRSKKNHFMSVTSGNLIVSFLLFPGKYVKLISEMVVFFSILLCVQLMCCTINHEKRLPPSTPCLRYCSEKKLSEPSSLNKIHEEVLHQKVECNYNEGI